MTDPKPADNPAPGIPDAPGLLVVISGPSGAGKTTIAHFVRERFEGIFSVSATTRARSAQERDGVDYHFIDDDRFQAMIDGDEFLEYARVFGRDSYGTPRGPVEDALGVGTLVFLDIDVQGALQVRESMPGALMIFVLPPSDEELLRRLRSRARDDEEAIQRRLEEAKREIDLANTSGAYDAFIVNDDLERAQGETSDLIERRLSEIRAK